MTYINTVFEDELRKRGISCRLAWSVKGPKDVEVACISCYFVGSSVVHVVTYKNECGWEVYTPSPYLGVQETVDYVLKCLEDRNESVSS